MLTKYPVFFFCVVSFFVMIKVDCQICERLESFTKMVDQTYFATTTTVNRRSVPKREWKTIKYCCNNYMRKDDLSDDSHIICEPICMPACTNGYCKSPGQCACHEGYNQDPGNSHNCLPVCEGGCDHGACIAPNTCKCDFGYTLVNGTCQPVCTEPCHNGTCVAPETCECLPGYRKSENNLCEPYCSSGCDNGYCAAPENCSCNTGWHYSESKDLPSKTCKPICSNPCGNGVCVAPDTCECLPSYVKSENGSCEPKCLSGWQLEGHQCVAQCKYSCGNGTCISPNVCSCFPGYEINLLTQWLGIMDEPVCVPVCVECKGECVAPNECVTGIPDDLCEYRNCSTGKPQDKTSVVPSVTSAIDDYYDEYGYDTFYDNLEPVPTVVSSNVSIDVSVDNNTETETKEGPIKLSWIQQHWVSIFIPLLVVVTAAIIMLLVWRWTPIIVFFKGRSYVVEGDPQDNNGSYPFEDIQISTTIETKSQEQK